MFHIVELLEDVQVVLVETDVILQTALLHEGPLTDFALVSSVVFVHPQMLFEGPKSGEGLAAYIAREHLRALVPGYVIHQAAFREEHGVAFVADEVLLL